MYIERKRERETESELALRARELRKSGICCCFSFVKGNENYVYLT